jgi:glutamate-1-semialdehyde 2,1-aminomutase
MNSSPLHFVYNYSEVDRDFWAEHLADWLPRRIIDAHTHIADPRFRLEPMTEVMRRQYWVNEVLEPIAASDAERCHRTVFPDCEVSCVAFGMPALEYDLDGGNDYLQHECAQRGWHSLAVICPQWSQEKVAALLDAPSVIGVKPYYALIGQDRETRDRYLEASIFDFLPHHVLEVVNDRHAWVTLHVPKAARLGHPDNLREVREIRRRYPNIVLVIAHLGRCYTEPHALEALPQLADDPGLFFDSSAVLNPASHRVALQHFGPERVLYGSDNPVMYMRGRRQYQGLSYLNRTNHSFHFNRDREPLEVEAGYTLYMYEDLRAIKQACTELGIVDRAQIQMIFHDNAARLIAGILSRKQQRSQKGAP